MTRTIILGGILAAAAMALMAGTPAQAQLKHYDSNSEGFWTHPPPDWFLGDETEQQKGLTPQPNPPTPATAAQLEDNLKKIKLLPGFKISVYAANVPEARQMAWATRAPCSSAPGSMPAMSMPSPTRAARRW
ncbi:MAG: hypothetical protein ACLQJR_15300 [Stellaceae bacterium]